MFGKRLVVSGAIAILIGALGACSSGGDESGFDDGVTYGQDDTGTGTGTATSAAAPTPTPTQDDTVHGLKDDVRHIAAKTARATRPHLVRKCTTATRRVRHTSSSGSGSKRKTRTWYTTERYRSCTKVRSGTETYRRTVRAEQWCVELDDVNGDPKTDDVWYQVGRTVYDDARAADDHARLEFVPAHEGC
ncbi:hypothetical protein ACGFZS_15195 [Streptomyces sp. NPDC048288]|uniref:hypothetical protein n=1 Tax=Streptomyces sp. NPDC048288 TaxID=3365529 RepID=UPI00371D770F